MAKKQAPTHCAECMVQFVRTNTPITANPRSRSYVHPTLCVGCSAERGAQMDPPMTFREMLCKALDNDFPVVQRGRPAKPKN